jgi:hypothetical protein
VIWLDIDPNVVRPGWTPLLITLGLAAVLVLLGLSMRKQMRRISPDLPYEADLRRRDQADQADQADPVDPVDEVELPPGDRPADLRPPPSSTSSG